MVVELVELIDAPVLGVLRWSVVAAVVEPFARVVPRDSREFYVADEIVEICAVFDASNADLLPIRTGVRDSIGQVAPVAAHRILRRRDRAVLGEFVGVEQHARIRVECFGGVENAVVLEAGLLRVEVPSSLDPWNAVLIEVPERRHAPAKHLAVGARGEEAFRDLVLRIDPRTRLGGVGVFEPTVRVRHFDAVQNVDDVALARRRVLETGRCRRGADSGGIGRHRSFGLGHRRSRVLGIAARGQRATRYEPRGQDQGENDADPHGRPLSVVGRVGAAAVPASLVAIGRGPEGAWSRLDGQDSALGGPSPCFPCSPASAVGRVAAHVARMRASRAPSSAPVRTDRQEKKGDRLASGLPSCVPACFLMEPAYFL